MRVGYFTMPLHPPGSDFSRTLNEDIEQIVTLDHLGYEEAWIGEHFTSAWENIPAPDLFIAKTLALTEKIILGTGVTCMPNHNPFIIAHRIAQLDHMAHGRFYWGVGSGSLSSDFKAFGLDPATGIHRSMTRDAIDQVLQLWEDPRPGLYEHKYWRFTVPEPVEEIGLHLHIKPFQKPHPPIGVAGASPKSDTLVLAGERGWIPMSINLVPTPTLQSHWEAVEEGAHRTGIVPDRSVWRVAREVFIADTDKEARKEALEGILSRDFRQYFLPLLAREKLLGLMKSDPDMADSDVTLEYLVDNVWIVGSPDTVTEKLRQLYDDLGGFGVLLAMGHEWQPKDKWIDSMTWLIEELCPGCRSQVSSGVGYSFYGRLFHSFPMPGRDTMTILVTGGAGLIGTRVVRKLLTEGHEVIHQDIRPPAREFNEGPGKLHVIVNDASQSEELLSIITTYNVERVIHLAAVLPLDSERHPHRTSLINVAGTTSLFEACLWTSRVKRIVYASSSSVYGPQSFYGERPVTEDDPLMPQMVYSAGKVCTELAADRYIDDHGMDIRGLRPASVFGHGRSSGVAGFMGPFISEPALGRPVKIPFDPASATPMIYVDDVAEYFIRVAYTEKLKHRIYNAGGPSHTLDDVYQILLRALPKVEVTFGDWEGRGLRLMSNERIESETGYVAPPLEQRVLDQINEAQQLSSATLPLRR